MDGKRGLGAIGAAVALLGLLGGSAEAIIAYQVPAGQVGNQNFGGPLGLDFNVNAPVKVWYLGVFDSAQDGLSLPLKAYIYNRTTQASLVSQTFPAGTPGTLIGGSRFLALPTPLVLGTGFQGSIVAENFNATDLNGNSSPTPPWTTNSGTGLLSFVGSARWGPTQGFYPPNPDGGPANRYAAGTFTFSRVAPAGEAAAVPVPNPSFELPARADGGFGSATSWTESAANQAGNWNPPTAGFPFIQPLPNGDHVAFINPTHTLTSNALGETLQADTLYILEAAWGQRTDSPNPRPSMSLRAGSVELGYVGWASNVNLLNGAAPGRGEFRTARGYFTANHNATLGSALDVRLANAAGGGQAIFDQVHLTKITGAAVPIVNFSFESPDTAPNSWLSPPTGWVVSGLAGVAEYAAEITPADGSQAAFVTGGSSLTQTLNTFLEPNRHYFLLVDVGDRSTFNFAGYSVELLAGGTTLAIDNNSLGVVQAPPGVGFFYTTSVVELLTGDTHPLVGFELGIRLSALGTGSDQAYFDNVRLFDLQVPEPATLVLLALGGAALAARRRRARRGAGVVVLAALLLSGLLGSTAEAVIAYQVPAGQVGNQNFGGPLGMDFDVLKPIRITELGVFDSAQNGLSLPLKAFIYDRVAPNPSLASLTFAAGTPGTLVGGSRFLPLATPLVLNPGFQGAIVAENFNSTDLNGNNASPPWTTDTGGGSLAFVGISRYGLVQGTYPGTPDAPPANRYAAGTFAFTRYILPLPQGLTAPVAVANPSFELPARADDGSGPAANWTGGGGGNWNPPGTGSPSFVAPLPHGDHVAFLTGGNLTSDPLGETLQANTLYILDVAWGERTNSPNTDHSMSLQAGGARLGWVNNGNIFNGPSPAPGRFADARGYFTANHNAPLGSTLDIVLDKGGTGQTIYDNVRLTKVTGGAVSVLNPSFEQNDVAPGGGSQVGAPGWVATGNAGVFEGATEITPADGSQSAYVTGGSSLTQYLAAVLEAHRRYILLVEVGDRAATSFAGYRVELLAGSTAVAVDNNSLGVIPFGPGNPGYFYTTSVLDLLVGETHPLLGMDLGIRLTALGAPSDQTYFDNVRLFTIQTPEPTTLALLAIGAALAARRRRARR